ARAIGYELRSGVAANVDLAFTIDGTPGAPGKTTIDVATRVQSVPKPGEQAQVFETVEAIEARAAWNAMRPGSTTRHPFTDAAGNLLTTYHFEGVSTGLRLGDPVLLAPPDHDPVLCLASRVDADFHAQQTVVDLRPVQARTTPARIPVRRSFLADELEVSARP